MIKGILCDFDGTIVDSEISRFISINHVLEDYKIKISKENWDKRYKSLGTKKILEDNEDIQDAWNVIRDLYRSSYDYNSDDVMLEMGRLLWMRRKVGQMWELPSFTNKLEKEEKNG